MNPLKKYKSFFSHEIDENSFNENKPRKSFCQSLTEELPAEENEIEEKKVVRNFVLIQGGKVD